VIKLSFIGMPGASNSYWAKQLPRPDSARSTLTISLRKNPLWICVWAVAGALAAAVWMAVYLRA
jgi:hypothetical protein